MSGGGGKVLCEDLFLILMVYGDVIHLVFFFPFEGEEVVMERYDDIRLDVQVCDTPFSVQLELRCTYGDLMTQSRT